MSRLTTNKPVDEMSMLELAYNSCYAENGKAMYRDFSFNTDARDLVRHIMQLQAKIELPRDNEEFDEAMLDYLQYDPATSIVGTVALLYRNLWAMADMRERLNAYEDKQEQGLLISLPCKVGDYAWDLITHYRFEITSIVINSRGTIFFKCGNKGTEDYASFSIEDIGDTWMITEPKESDYWNPRPDAEEALRQMKGE